MGLKSFRGGRTFRDEYVLLARRHENALLNLDEMHIFYGFKSTSFERTEDQMSLLMAQHQAVAR